MEIFFLRARLCEEVRGTRELQQFRVCLCGAGGPEAESVAWGGCHQVSFGKTVTNFFFWFEVYE